MINKDLLVKKIEKGVVIDHISAGQALLVLNILRPDPLDRIVLARNVDSSRFGTKDIIKVEGKYLTSKEIDLISLVAPEATINIIENWEVKEKIKVNLPNTIERFFKCPNRSCITNSDYTSEFSNFKILEGGDMKSLKLQCVFCDAYLYSEAIMSFLANTDFIGGIISREKIEKLFLELLLKKGALKIALSPKEFFILKSGRQSPYFINIGSLTDGDSLAKMKRLLASYVKLLLDQEKLEDFDFVFGPAYKGINLASLVCEGLSESYGINKRYIYDRKEEKQYGDVSADRMIVGGDQFREGQRILIIDDVTTTGSTKIEALNKLRSLGSHEVTGLVLVVDRQEKREETINRKVESAVDFIRRKMGINVFSILNSKKIFHLVKNNLTEEVRNHWITYFDRFGTVKLQE